MATRAVSEYEGKHLLSHWLEHHSGSAFEVEKRALRVQLHNAYRLPETQREEALTAQFSELEAQHPWVHTEQLVVKPDQLIKRRGKNGLVGLKLDWAGVRAWVSARMGKPVTVDKVEGHLDTFIVEPMFAHSDDEELYVCIMNNRQGEEVLFYHQGGVDVGDVDAKAARLNVSLMDDVVSADEVSDALLGELDCQGAERKAMVATFLQALFHVYRELNFSYMEINPLVIRGKTCAALDLAAKLDETAEFLCGSKWAAALPNGGHINFPTPFGRPLLPEEQHVHDLDAKTGASLKLTVLNPAGRVWTMVAGGGASVVYADTISDLGFGGELANYGEYSGAPSEELTFEYARSILRLMTEANDARGKVLIIGGGIANFTDVAKTFSGIVKALREFSTKLVTGKVTIWVRRGGPNYQEGLKLMRELGESIGVPIHVYGPETNIVAIVPMALGLADSSNAPDASGSGAKEDNLLPIPTISNDAPMEATAMPPKSPSLSSSRPAALSVSSISSGRDPDVVAAAAQALPHQAPLMDVATRAVVFGLQPRAVQEMLDFDYICKRKEPSVAAMVFPFSGNHYQKFYWGKDETMIPVYKSMREALNKHREVTVMVNFSSFRSAYSTSMEAISQHSDQLKAIAIIAEGIPEKQTRTLIHEANERGVMMIGPATVGGIKPGCFRIGNTGGMIDNILSSKLYRPGSVAYVSKSGGMSNELNNIISTTTNGVYEGVAIGGDRYPGSRFIDHLLRYQDDPNVKILVLLGEVGGVDEYAVCKAMTSGRINKPVVAWCIGTCAKMFPYEVQFGHAGALANAQTETADAKNAALRAAGGFVPRSFDRIGDVLATVYRELVEAGTIVPKPEPPVPKVPMDFQWAKQLGLVRKPAAFVSSICDDRGEELLYAGMPISKVFAEDIGLGGVVSLLWFRRRLPDYACKFIEMVLMVTADHGPAVSGAHNTIVTARAGKDLISSLVSGLLTIGPRFGGALDAAAKMFSEALDHGSTPKQFVSDMRTQNKLIMGIGHKIKSLSNPDMRVTIIKNFAHEHFPQTEVLDFALEVEQITTQKKANLILNVDGCIACCFVDLLRNCGAFTREEADEALENGLLNGLFVLGRSVGFIGHYLDQRRLKQGLYRHPFDDISYMVPSAEDSE